MITFQEEGHKYEGEDINWISVSTVCSKYENKFDAEDISVKQSKKKTSKWYGLTPQEIRDKWKSINKQSTERGSWYHDTMYKNMISIDTLEIDGHTYKVHVPEFIASDRKEKYKIATIQKLEDNSIYPEFFMYLKSVGICGQSDKVIIKNKKIYVKDFKTNFKIDFESYKSWDGRHKMMLTPLAHLMDCNYVHYCLQLSMYMYILLKNNPQLEFGGITLQHVLFEVEGVDEYDYPIYRLDEHGNYIIKDIIDYDIKYLKTECKILLDFIKTNK